MLKKILRHAPRAAHAGRLRASPSARSERLSPSFGRYRSLQPVPRKAAAPLAHLHLAGEAGVPAACGKSLLQPKGEER